MTGSSRDLAVLIGALLDRHRGELDERALSTRLELDAGLRLGSDDFCAVFQAAFRRIVGLLLASLPDGCELYVSAHRNVRARGPSLARLLMRAQVSGRDPGPRPVVQRLRPVPRSAEQLLGSSILAESFVGLEAIGARCTALSPAAGEVLVRIELPLEPPPRLVPVT